MVMKRSSTRFYFRVALLSIMLQFVAGGCEDTAVGLSDSTKIANNKFSSSSVFNASTPASNGRLNYTGGPSWCASSSDSTLYLEVDLGSAYIICAVATQGNSQADDWVKTYQIRSSKDATNWTPYKEKGQDVIFQGNYDRTTTVKHLLFEGLQARYIRVYPKTRHGSVCLRLELFGKSNASCSSAAIGIADSSTIPNYRFTASSTYHDKYYEPWYARLEGSNGWTPSTKTNVPNEWLQIDLGSSFFICAVATQGHSAGYEWIKKYKLRLSNNNQDWKYYKEAGTERVFTGNTDGSTVIKQVLQELARGKLIQIKPIQYNLWPSVRVEAYGITQVCRSSLGMESSSIPDSQITDSTGMASNGRLYKSGATWCGTTVLTDYLQVDLGRSVTILGVATQGDSSANNWVKEYSVKYSRDGTTWYDYKENQQNKTFTGNTDQNSVHVNWFNNSVSARYIRVYPTSANGNPCMRMDLYGCVHVLAPAVEVTDTENSPISGRVSFTCNATGNPDPIISWEYKNSDLTSKSSIVTQSNGDVNGLTSSRLDVTTPGIDAVLSDYTCRRTKASTREVECTSPPYLCKARYNGGPYSVQTAAVVTNLDVPRAPTVTIGSIQLSSVHISWTHDESSSDPLKEKPVKSFKITISVTGNPDITASLGSSVSSYVLKDPVLYKTYTVKVIAVSDVGEGLVGSANFDTDFPPTPSSMSVPKLFGRSAVISWVQPPSTSGEGAVTSFKIDYGVSGESSNVRSVTVSSSTTSATLVGLRLSAVYNVTVIPFSTRGAGLGLSKTIHTKARCDGVPIVISAWSSSTSFNATTAPTHGQLNYTAGSSWCASSSDSSPYLEVDLGSDHLICAITTQGNDQADQWVKTYQVQTSKDRSSWSNYKEDSQTKLFDGNYDRNTEVKHINYGVMQGRYLRVLPKSHHGGTCLRLAVYGVSTQACSSSAVGVQNSLAVPDNRFTASTFYALSYRPQLARLDGVGGWTSTAADRDTSWLQIDLGDVNVICAVTTQGRSSYDEWTKSYKLKLSLSNSYWEYYKEGGADKVFQGNTDRNTKVKRELSEVSQAKLIQFRPQTYNSYPVLRVEVYSSLQACKHSLGVEDGSISNSSLSASSGRLYGASSWCASSSRDYLQVDLGGVRTVTGIATQGDPGNSKYVTSYSISYRKDGSSWEDYKDSAHSKMIFSHTKMNKLEVNWIPTPLATDSIRVFPVTSVGGRCLRLDVYGCDGVVAKPSVSMTDLLLPSFRPSAVLICRITGQPYPEVKWQLKGNGIFSSETRSSGVITSTHTVSYTNAASILSDHVCRHVNVSTRHVTCTSPPYACKARYTGGKFGGKSAVVVVNLLTPDAVTDLAAEASRARSLTIKWTRPDAGDISIISYTVEYGKDVNGATKETRKASTTSHVITDLKPYTTYAIRVVAVSAVGVGLWSAPIKPTTDQAAPSEPQNVVIKADSHLPRVTISWTAPMTPNGDITRYTVYYRYIPDGNLSTVNTNGGAMNVTVNITGGMEYRFNVSATTIAEGPKTDVVKKLREYAPDAAPRGFTFVHFNATTYNCSWDPPPRDRSHGTITGYDVKYTSQPTVRRKRSIDEVLVNTSKTHILLFNLKLCKRFSISVRARTNIGAGPFSKELSLENAAIPPQKVEAVKKGTNEVEVSWTEPPRLGGEIEGYKVKFVGTKAYNKSFRHVGEQETSSRLPPLLVVVNLVPGTVYQFEVATKAGCTEVAYSRVKPTAETDVADPVPPKVEVTVNPSSGTQITVTFSPTQAINGPISSYQIIVLRVEEGVTTLPTDYESNLKNFKNAEESGLSYYISAEIPKENVTTKTQFTVGDGTIRGSYLNAKLKEGGQYIVFLRVMTEYKGKIYPSKPEKLAQATVKKKSVFSPDKKGGGSLAIILGVVVAVIVFLVIAVLAVVYLRRRRNRDQSGKSGRKQAVPMNALRTIENGNSSLQLVGDEDDGTYGRKVHAESKKELKPENAFAENKYKVPEVAAKDDSQPIYSNAMGEEEPKAIPVVQFSEYMNRVKLGDYARLRQEYQTFPKVKQFPWTEAEKPANKKYNRYGNIIAYDHTRVILEDYKETNYINANYIHGWDGTPHVYIATQGPNQSSVPSFWHMIWNQNVSTIVMTTNLVEGGKKKCFQYWPDNSGTHGEIQVTLIKSEVFADFTIRTFEVKKGSQSRTITQFHFTVWPDHGVPRLPSNIISLRRRVRSRIPPNTGPMVVHCSAGVGRTGTFIVIDAMLEQAKKEKKVDIFNFLTVIRNDRIHMVQTDDQYVFIHKAVLEALTCGNTELDLRKNNLRHTMKKLTAINQTHGKTGYEMEFERLGFVCPDASADECEAAYRPENQSKNRNLAFAPLDISRVLISRQPHGGHNDYINASFADAFRERNAFIMTQAPLPNTMEDFWQTVIQCSIGCVVMLNNLKEGSESYPKYWPNEISKTANYGKITVKLQSEENRGDIILRKLSVADKEQAGAKPLAVRHLQYTAWPDHSVPGSALSVLKLVTEVQNALQLSGKVELVAHCSDGVGRSGTFCSIYSALERVKLEQVLDVFQAIKDIRVRRPSAVETPDQYKFCYEIVQVYLDSFSDYANFSDC